MDLQALGSRGQSYLYDGAYRARETLSLAQRASFGLRANPDPRFGNWMHAAAPASGGNSLAFHGCKQRRRPSSSGAPKSNGCGRIVEARFRLLARHPRMAQCISNRLKKKLVPLHSQAGPLHRDHYTSLKLQTPTAVLRCNVWRGRVFLLSTRVDGSHA